MIQFTLKCDQDHRFDSWFQSAGAFDKLKAAGMVTCAVCGSGKVEKAIMAPRVQASRSKSAVPSVDAPTSVPAGMLEPSAAEQALAKLKKQVEDNSEYVGMNFAREARDMHDGIAPERAIYGEAKPEEAKKLIEDGVPVAPLPFVPGRKAN
ncbi:hypothetical protein ROA7450_00242 [Roseovarius albus]|uniref:Uncharacterized protein n=1 Tax=Roseovarius albus TaxID=1247867 RepID=A0A1X6Y8U8_9RHOB|nr:DUF1178 family protein [Roseovarius albus]SLN14032.1 hypothetical protein ROA7450_00242 [Roseovarius albus]